MPNAAPPSRSSSRVRHRPRCRDPDRGKPRPKAMTMPLTHRPGRQAAADGDEPFSERSSGSRRHRLEATSWSRVVRSATPYRSRWPAAAARVIAMLAPSARNCCAWGETRYRVQRRFLCRRVLPMTRPACSPPAAPCRHAPDAATTTRRRRRFPVAVVEARSGARAVRRVPDLGGPGRKVAPDRDRSHGTAGSRRCSRWGRGIERTADCKLARALHPQAGC